MAEGGNGAVNTAKSVLGTAAKWGTTLLIAGACVAAFGPAAAAAHAVATPVDPAGIMDVSLQALQMLPSGAVEAAGATADLTVAVANTVGGMAETVSGQAANLQPPTPA